jgi:predicted nucleic acid-binding protein
VPDDRWHDDAVVAFRALLARGLTLITTNFVVSETYTLLRRAHDHGAAMRFLDRLSASPRVEKLHVDAAIDRAAEDILRRFDDQEFSFVDGTSFAVMRRRRIRLAFAFDVHFATAGFVRIPLDQHEP